MPCYWCRWPLCGSLLICAVHSVYGRNQRVHQSIIQRLSRLLPNPQSRPQISLRGRPRHHKTLLNGLVHHPFISVGRCVVCGCWCWWWQLYSGSGFCVFGAVCFCSCWLGFYLSCPCCSVLRSGAAERRWGCILAV